jgi:predicted sulfurtransferase
MNTKEQKIILYYKFTPVKDPEMTMRWQRELCLRLGLKGRILISPHGINGGKPTLEIQDPNGKTKEKIRYND